MIHGCAKRGQHTGAYRAWRSMWSRCTIPSDTAYPNYGGRGISICEQWVEFAAFLADMGERPDNLSLDRIDNDGNYEPSNCRWATRQVQQLNRRPKKRGKAYKKNKSGACGVRRRGERWLVQISVKGKALYVGSFPSLAAAVLARKTTERELGLGRR